MTGLLVANRGEIAIRIARAARELGLHVVMVHSVDDGRARHLDFGDERHALPGRGAAAYLDVEALVSAARETRCDLVHPGYGFLSESTAFSRACAQAGLTFVGPPPEALALLGDKARARDLAGEHDVPVPAGLGGPVGVEEARAFLESLGPDGAVMLKAIAGGGGRGTRPVRDAGDLETALKTCQAEAQASFGNPDLYVEELIEQARHIEIQVLADRTGACMHAYERECTLQRSRQKLVEIAPSPTIDPEQRAALTDAALRLARASGVCGLATFEFLMRPDGRFVFIEANPRLQVEHTVTEAITGLDLVQIQLRLAQGATLAELGLGGRDLPLRGMALQARINAEIVSADGAVRPAGEPVTCFEPPTGPGLRIDTAGHTGYRPNPAFDTLLAKLIVHSETGGFAGVLARARSALHEFRIEGCRTNRSLLEALLGRSEVRDGTADTEFADRIMGELVAEAARLDTAGQAHDEAGVDTVPTEAPVPEGEQAVRAPTSGVVVSLEVAADDTVRAGQSVLIIEAMKMEHEVAAPADAVFSGWRVGPGDPVMEGQCLATVRPVEGLETAAAEAQAYDPDHIRPDLDEVFSRRTELTDASRPDAVERRRSRNQRTARENVEDLCDPGSFMEYGAFNLAAQRSRRTPEELREKSPADGMIAGFGSINGARFGEEASRCAVFAYDFTVFAGTQGAYNHKKKDRMIDLVARAGVPLVVFAEGGGGRPGETDTRLGLDIPTFARFAELSGQVPLVGIVSGYCFAGNAALLGCADVIIATENASIGMGGPAMIEGGGLGVYRPGEVGPVDMQRRNGVIDIVVADEAEAVATARRYLSYFQGPVDEFEAHDPRRLRALIPENRMRVYDIREVIEQLADVDSVLELKPDYGRAAVTALVRIGGRPMGLIANDPQFISGAIDADAASKMTDFLHLCDAHGLPVLSLCDTPGFMVGPEIEAQGQVRKACRLFIAGAQLSVPLFSVVVRKAYGLGAQAMVGGCFHSPFFSVAWPTGEFGAMGLEGAVRLGFRRELEAIEDEDERAAYFDAKLQSLYDEGKALTVAEFMEIDDVIDPAETRDWILRGLETVAARAPERGRPG
ncbi:MAG: carboxyl transferase domain-containing protein [Pseudomonadota bacterium]|nr:carboxyl transferase domain-containing protein [Pseudomonadota bacterium]